MNDNVTSFLDAIAQSLCNLGFTDATRIGDSVFFRGMYFYASSRPWRKSFTFCGRSYRIGSVKQAVLDLIQALPQAITRRDKELEIRRRDMQLKAINAAFEGCNLSIMRHGEQYTMSYTADLDRLEEIAKQIISAVEVSLAPLDTMLAKLSASFDAEGGFSLN